jgi:hypothetical protein
MRRAAWALLLLVAVGGCGASPPPVATTDQFVKVINLEGEETSVAAGELFDSQTGEAAVQRVFVLDRQTGTETWVDVDELSKSPPTIARYLRITQAAPHAEEE